MLFCAYPFLFSSSYLREQVINIKYNYINGDFSTVFEIITRLLIEYEGTKDFLYIRAIAAHISLVSPQSNQLRVQYINELLEEIKNPNSFLADGTFNSCALLHDVYSILKSQNLNVGSFATLSDFETALSLPLKTCNTSPIHHFKRYQVVIPQTGFFAYFEHICISKFFANLYNINLTVISSNWKHQIKLEEIFTDVSFLISSEPVDAPFLDLNKLRLAYVNSFNLYASDLARFKMHFYSSLASSIESLIVSRGPTEACDLIHNPKPTAFLRRSSKITLLSESIFPRDEIVLESLQPYATLYLLGDDISYNNFILKERGSIDHLINFRVEDSTFPDSISCDENSTWEILTQWLVMVRSISLCASSDSSMANTAHLARALTNGFVPHKGFFNRPTTFQ